jgi:hypothetical protein
VKNDVLTIGASSEPFGLAHTCRPWLDAVTPLRRVLQRVSAQQTNIVASIEKLGYSRLPDDTGASGYQY